jgi:putative ABC transport system permease protein
MFSDLRYAFRQLKSNPGFAAVAILTLALGIGACTAIFSVVNGVLLQPFDYPHSQQIVVIRETNLPKFPEFTVSPPNYLDWVKETKSWRYLAAYTGTEINLTGAGEPQRLLGVKATGHYFDVYGIQPLLGRWFVPDEDADGKNRVAVLSYPFWQRVFGGERNVIGRSIQLDGDSYTVLGVAPPHFGEASKIDTWIPMGFKPGEINADARGGHYLNVIGRLRPGVTFEHAKAELEVLAAQLARQYPNSNKGWSIKMWRILDYWVSDVRAVLYTLLGAVGCVLLIACANIANLLLARASARQREISIRTALGASRLRLVRQLLTESILLALAGGAIGVLFARWGLDLLLCLAPSTLPRTNDIRLDLAVLTFTLFLSVLTGVIFGIAPALLAAHTDMQEGLKQGARGSTDARGRLRGALVITEIAFALVLLGGAGLLARSFMRLTNVDPGFVADDATVLRLALPEKKYEKPEQQLAFADALLGRLRLLPGVKAAGLTQSLPLISDWVLGFKIDGRPEIPPSDLPSTNYYSVTPDYFHAMGIRLVRGRLFSARDDSHAPRVAIINETLARQFFPNEDPLGKRLLVTNGPDVWRQIVGIVADTKQYGVDQETKSQTYEPYAQSPFRSLDVVLRTSDSGAALIGALRPAVYAIDKDQPVGTIQPLAEILGATMAKQRFAMLLLVVFSSVALVIAAVGIYGVMAYSVVQRTSEFGIRMALGAQPSDVLRLVLFHAGKLVGLGLGIGLGASFAASRVMGSMLFQTNAHDPLTFSLTTLLLAAVAVAACLLPARRATRVNPIEALRTE